MENRLKERLTGAAILVALIVMLVPEMFHGQRGDVAATASSSGEGPPLRSYTIDLSNSPAASAPLQATAAGPGNDDKPATVTPLDQPTPAPASAPTPAQASAPTPAQASAPTATPAPAPTPTPTAPPRPVHAAAPPPAPAPAGGGQSGSTASGWVVQLGLFAKRDNAERLQHAAQAKGFAVKLSNADARGLYRVYAGGMADRAAAEGYAQRLKDQGMPAAVVASP
jgi:cell division septation protein DedD